MLVLLFDLDTTASYSNVSGQSDHCAYFQYTDSKVDQVTKTILYRINRQTLTTIIDREMLIIYGEHTCKITYTHS